MADYKVGQTFKNKKGQSKTIFRINPVTNDILILSGGIKPQPRGYTLSEFEKVLKSGKFEPTL